MLEKKQNTHVEVGGAVVVVVVEVGLSVWKVCICELLESDGVVGGETCLADGAT